MKKKVFLWMLAAVIATGGASLMTSCIGNEDDPVVNPDTPGSLDMPLDGVWYSHYPSKGTLQKSQNGEKLDYTYVLEYYQFNTDGTGVWNRMFFNTDQDEPLENLGSKVTGHFTYTSQSDGKVTVTLDNKDLAGLDEIMYAPVVKELQIVEEKAQTRADEEDNQEMNGKGVKGQSIVLERDNAGINQVFTQWNDLHKKGLNNQYDHVTAINQDVRDVYYSVQSDETHVIGYTLWKVLHSQKRTALTDAAVAELIKVGRKPANDKSSTRASGKWPVPATGYRSVNFTYQSVDEQGKPVELSGRAVWSVVLGFRDIRPDYIMLTPHYTISDDFECPTSGRSIEDLMLAGDKLLIIPDYIGFGVTKDHVQPYIIHDLCAQNCIDALRAGYKAFRDLSGAPMEANFTLSVAGVSQGGGVALAVHKWLDTHPEFAERWNFDFSYCGAGPYSPPVTFEKYFEQKKLTYPVVMLLVIKAMRAAYPEILGKWWEEEFFSESFKKQLAALDKMVDSKEYTSDEINKFIFDMYPYKGATDIQGGKEVWLSDIVSPEIMNRESEMCKALFECLEKNDLTKGWTPIHPIHLYHGKTDDIVNYANAEAVMKAFPDKADLSSPAVAGGHIGTSLQWLMSIFTNKWRWSY